eukprot:snap_masked-scaffold_1-processed-gene-8.19-mRNA-1 protein AED:1.00 eAED:1.00 QI:0/0/0/0/1/1/2/0/59
MKQVLSEEVIAIHMEIVNDPAMRSYKINAHPGKSWIRRFGQYGVRYSSEGNETTASTKR